MRSFVILFVVIVSLCAFTESRIFVKREVEREDSPKETVVVSDNRNDVELINDNNKGNSEVVEFDFNDRDGVLSFGGRIPAFDMDRINQRMNEMIAAMLRRMHELHKQVNQTTSKYPDNYNDTKVEYIEIGGKQYKKETTVVNKKIHGMTVFSKSTVIVPVEESDTGSVDTNPGAEKPAQEPPKVDDKDDKNDGFDERE